IALRPAVSGRLASRHQNAGDVSRRRERQPLDERRRGLAPLREPCRQLRLREQTRRHLGKSDQESLSLQRLAARVILWESLRDPLQALVRVCRKVLLCERGEDLVELLAALVVRYRSAKALERL